MSNPNPDPTETEPTAPMDAKTARRIEQEKMTRRAALRKLGFGAGLAAFSMLGVDDFARLAGKRMERMAGDNKVAGQIAKEFQSAGIALAAPANPSGTGGTSPPCDGTGCAGCADPTTTATCCNARTTASQKYACVVNATRGSNTCINVCAYLSALNGGGYQDCVAACNTASGNPPYQPSPSNPHMA